MFCSLDQIIVVPDCFFYCWKIFMECKKKKKEFLIYDHSLYKEIYYFGTTI